MLLLGSCPYTICACCSRHCLKLFFSNAIGLLPGRSLRLHYASVNHPLPKILSSLYAFSVLFLFLTTKLMIINFISAGPSGAHSGWRCMRSPTCSNHFHGGQPKMNPGPSFDCSCSSSDANLPVRHCHTRRCSATSANPPAAATWAYHHGRLTGCCASRPAISEALLVRRPAKKRYLTNRALLSSREAERQRGRQREPTAVMSVFFGGAPTSSSSPKPCLRTIMPRRAPRLRAARHLIPSKTHQVQNLTPRWMTAGVKQ